MNENENETLNTNIEPGRIGWWGIRHHGGWWVGSDKGANTYEDRYFARIAMTLLWQREGGRVCHYAVERFTGANIIAGEFTPKKSAEQAITDYEAKNLRP